MIDAAVTGVGLWTTGFADPAAFRARMPDPAVALPAPTLVSARHLRFTSLLTRMAALAFEQAVAGAGLDLAEIEVVFGSALGEIQIAVELLDRIALEGGASPARFMNSVHNTAPGHLSIATASRGGGTALAAGDATVAAALIEALARLGEPGGAERVVVVVADEPSPSRLGRPTYPPLAAALLLERPAAAAAAGRSARARLQGPIRAIDAAPASAGAARLADLGPLGANPCAPALVLIDAALGGEVGPIALERATGEADAPWCVRLVDRAAAAAGEEAA